MIYKKNNWEDSPSTSTPINAANLNHMEEGIYNANEEAKKKMNAENPTGTGSFSMNRKADTTVGDYSTTEGYNCEASGKASHAEGYGFTKASGESSHAEGYGTKAIYTASHAEGSGTKATNYISHAEGTSTIASGHDSHAEGVLTKAKVKEKSVYIEDEVTRIEIYSNSTCSCFKSGLAKDIGSIGKTIFLTPKEAEQALKEMENNR